eukprot:TRINITY_DN4217_c0_g2_i1.p1 TRINITY_DN4217_c0_g2~~TRINITY_DN4217_c0_g2_i1.p1  ORF type:complete len:267 (+),score=77.82 TRINITY_DN4217_c0_g2_i1:194-994(+)
MKRTKAKTTPKQKQPKEEQLHTPPSPPQITEDGSDSDSAPEDVSFGAGKSSSLKNKESKLKRMQQELQKKKDKQLKRKEFLNKIQQAKKKQEEDDKKEKNGEKDNNGDESKKEKNGKLKDNGVKGKKGSKTDQEVVEEKEETKPIHISRLSGLLPIGLLDELAKLEGNKNKRKVYGSDDEAEGQFEKIIVDEDKPLKKKKKNKNLTLAVNLSVQKPPDKKPLQIKQDEFNIFTKISAVRRVGVFLIKTQTEKPKKKKKKKKKSTLR